MTHGIFGITEFLYLLVVLGFMFLTARTIIHIFSPFEHENSDKSFHLEEWREFNPPSYNYHKDMDRMMENIKRELASKQCLICGKKRKDKDGQPCEKCSDPYK